MRTFEAREGGVFSLTYQDPGHFPRGKTSVDTDTFQGKLVELVPGRKIVEVVRFESQDPAFDGEMRITVSLTNAAGGTEVGMLFEDIPRGLSLDDNEQASKSS